MQTVEENQLPHESGAPLLDMESIKRLKSLNSDKDPDFFARLVEAFITFGKKNVTGMNEALLTNDWAAISRCAHALKGSCSNFGAANAVKLCLEVEKLSAEQQWSAIPRLTARITNEFTLISNMLRSISH